MNIFKSVLEEIEERRAVAKILKGKNKNILKKEDILPIKDKEEIMTYENLIITDQELNDILEMIENGADQTEWEIDENNPRIIKSSNGEVAVVQNKMNAKVIVESCPRNMIRFIYEFKTLKKAYDKLLNERGGNDI